MDRTDPSKSLYAAERGIAEYLNMARNSGQIDEQSHAQATRNTFPALKEWLLDEHIPKISPRLIGGLCELIPGPPDPDPSKPLDPRWEELVNAFGRNPRHDGV